MTIPDQQQTWEGLSSPGRKTSKQQRQDSAELEVESPNGSVGFGLKGDENVEE